jgi:hypothetical protein
MKKSRLVLALFISIFVSIGVAKAQTSCTTITQTQILNSFSDNAAVGSITPQTLRNFVCSIYNFAFPIAGGNLLGETITAASTTGSSGFNIPPGSTPSSPNNGDIWTTSAGMFVRINGTTIGPLAATFGTYLPLSGGTMAGNIAMGANTISNAVISGSTLSGATVNGTTTASGTFTFGGNPVSTYTGSWPGSSQCVETSGATGVLSFTGAACSTAPTGANPTATATGTAVNGSSTSFMRADGAPAVASTTVAGSTCTPGSTCGLTSTTASLSNVVVLNNTSTYFDGPGVAQGTTGTWFASGCVTLVDGNGSATFLVKMWDHTTIIASTVVQSTGAGFAVEACLSGVLTSPASNIRISVQDSSSNNGAMENSISGALHDSTISAFRVN